MVHETVGFRKTLAESAEARIFEGVLEHCLFGDIVSVPFEERGTNERGIMEFESGCNLNLAPPSLPALPHVVPTAHHLL